MASQEAIQLLDEIIEDTKQLALFNWVSAKQQNDDVRDYSFKALRIPSKAQHLTRQEYSGSKRPAFNEGFKQHIQLSEQRQTPISIEPEEVFPTDDFLKGKEMTVTSEQLPSQLEKHHDTSMATIGSGKGIPTTVYEETNTMDLDAQEDFSSRPNGSQQSRKKF
ncbi:hypothetical protein RMATCC62417_14068 [Rhizopus microsporus]|nr:hypothetical protein RMATCC62417_14068 [Rhizopus microsporus]